MLIILMILGGAIGVMLGLIALSFVAREVHQPAHAEPEARERRPHQHIEPSSRAQRYPTVPPPLAPMTTTPEVLLPSLKQAQAAAPPAFVTPEVRVDPDSHQFVAPPVAASAPVPVVQFVPPAVKPVTPEKKKELAFIAFDAAKAISSDDELVSLLKQGHFVAAIDRYRRTHGVGVAEAKAALKAWRSTSEAHEALADSVEAAVTDPQIVSAIREGKFIEAIKLYRAKTGVSLQDAKHAIDAWRKELGS
jgi:ribosomal protein L7/L12